MARYRGRHRAPSTTGRTLARTAVAGAVLSAPAIAAPAASADTGSAWDRLAQCESSGNWAINTGNGFSGGLQFTPSTWRAFGGQGLAHHASREQQIAVAERVLSKQGWGAWPACSRKLGLRGTPAPVHVAPQATPSTSEKTVESADTGSSADTVRVRAGDTLSRIAAAHHVTGGWQALRDANPGLNPHKLRIGTVLQMH
jgi:resuscitation-promoting factor RpfA